jgi:hypothetical protein
MIGRFLNLQGQLADYFYPGAGDTGILGTVCAAWKNGGGQVRADANQNVPNSAWAGAPASGSQGDDPIAFGNPLVISFDAIYFVPVPGQPGDFDEIAQNFCVGQRVSFDVVAAEYGAVAQNLVAL